MLHLPSSQLSLQNQQDKGGPIVANGAVVRQRGGAPATKIFSLQAHNVGKCISLVLPVLVTLKEPYM
jgi:hypothetical protein